MEVSAFRIDATSQVPAGAHLAAAVEVAERLVVPGAFFTGSERRAMAMHARRARGLVTGGTGPEPLVAETVERIAAQAWTSRSEHVENWVAARRSAASFVEVVSVVSALCAIDSFTIALDGTLIALPPARAGSPTGVVDQRSEFVNCWVPTVGPGSATMALSALPDEMAINRHMQHGWYLSDHAIFDFPTSPAGALSRQQIELLAARTSAVNDCFY